MSLEFPNSESQKENLKEEKLKSFINNFLKSSESEANLNRLHKDFNRIAGNWYCNLNFVLREAQRTKMDLKNRAGFKDPHLLDDCRFPAKIGFNKDARIPLPYIVFIYGQNKHKEILEDMARKFPYSEIISGLDNDWISNEKSTTSIVNGNQKEE
ncbi:hypothetical protein A2Z53_02030 [Candidatus Giovannonibacteria bacterium RIFCSPHIGHO2_02_42_15]|uniref:Uncharacterized protein n=2 Tax=Candidatus Giovannoniibacteriota TaxID=1752738 RepID=A0A1F5VPT6_9BACT|nr:MAG: hypothetical protein UV11_C0045G0003 [Candidatus Giovannonibacteria bacterium GW2011_GWF2_42_19]OGF65377.1 MAG: hypothetical protein A2Z53_02030 [Candidatus Giovannonibacteria bacterium RIFCSPHIGHO2_02_42_15]HBB49339.1 hypothetical protein [Candidatus Nomurabacteria bacterium]